MWIGPSCAVARHAPGPDAKTLAAQILLDRLDFGPGVIDGHKGMSFGKALRGFQEARDIPVTGTLDAATVEALSAYSTTPATIVVTLSPADLAGPFVGPIPHEPADQAKLPSMGYSDAMEELAERYHTTNATLIALNSPHTLLRPGARIRVPNVRPAVSN